MKRFYLVYRISKYCEELNIDNNGIVWILEISVLNTNELKKRLFGRTN